MTSLAVLPAVISMAGIRRDALRNWRPLAGKRSFLQDCCLAMNKEKQLAPLSPQIRTMTLRIQGMRDPNLRGEGQGVV